MAETRNYDVRKFGARGDGAALDGEAIQKAIDRCGGSGGGTVFFPAGVYLCGTLQLRSNVCLSLDMGARLLAVDKPELFPEICKTAHGNLPGQIQALLWAQDVENVAIVGPGAVDGGHPEALPSGIAAGDQFRPALVFFRNCRNVKFLDVTLQYSAFWTLHLQRCTDVLVRGCTIRANLGRINADGIDPDGCRNVVISDCNIEVGDDAICIKSTEGDPAENITVANCILRSSCACLKIGTEAMGDIRNVAFNNCVIHGSNVGLALYMKDGSTYENVIFSNMVIESSNQYPILVDNTPRYCREPRKGRIRSVVFENVVVTSPGRCFVEGLPDAPIEDLTFRNITWNVTGPLKVEGAMKPRGARRTETDPNAVNYSLNPYHFVAVNVRDLEVSNFKLYDRNPDPDRKPDRGLFYLNGVRGAAIERVRAIPTPPRVAAYRLVRCAGVARAKAPAHRGRGETDSAAKRRKRHK